MRCDERERERREEKRREEKRRAKAPTAILFSKRVPRQSARQGLREKNLA
jgi:hypothetical protein